MGTTAEKLTYLNTTKGKIKDSINLTGAGITNQDTFRSYASKLKLGLIDIINNGTDNLYSNFPKVSGIGSNLSLTPTYEAPMRNLPLGNTYQQTYTGKNLLPYPYESTGTTVNGITFTPQSDGSVLVNGTATAQATFPLYGTSSTTNQKELTGNYLYGGTSDVRLRAYNHSGSGYTNLGTDTGNGVQINKTTYTTGYIELVVPSGTTINNVVIKPMMLMNLDDTTYEPYVGGVSSPNPDYSQAIQSATGLQNIEICGKNLFDKNNTSNLLDNVSINNSTSVISDANGFYSLKINCKPNTTYTISKVVSSRFIVAYSNNSTYTSGEVLLGKIANNSATSLTITTGSEAKLLYVFYSKLSDETTYTLQQILDSIQIEESLTAAEYEPYKGNTYEVNLGKNLSRIEDGTTTINGLTITVENGTITLNGTTTSSCVFKLTNGLDTISDSRPNTNWFNENVVDKLAGKVLSINNISGSGPSSSWAIRLFKSTTTYLYQYTPSTFSGDKVYTSGDNISCICIFTNQNLTFDNYKIQIQLEKGTKSTSFSPYFTPIELNKINTYQDRIYKDNGKWYVEKQTGKVVLNGSETGWGNYTNGTTGLLTFRKQLNEIKSYTQSVNIICDYFVRTKGSNPTNNQFMNRYGNNQNLEFVYTNITSLNDFKTWLNTHNVSVYFALTTPTINEITNEELIEQLESLYTTKSQEGTTNILITSEDLPMLLSASALKGDA